MADELVPNHVPVSMETLVALVNVLSRDVRELKAIVTAQYVTRTEFDPFKKQWNAVVTVILTAFVGGLVTLWVQSQ